MGHHASDRIWVFGHRYVAALPPRLRRVLAAAVLLGAAVAVLCGFLGLWKNVLARLHLHHGLTWYDLGFYGLAPSVQYHTLDLRAPSVEFLRTDARCSRDPVFFGWRGPNVAHPAAIILDGDGELVWRSEGFGGPQQDLRVQAYRGEKFLTFWAGMEEGGQTAGLWYMMDESYTIRHQIRPNGFAWGDMHEFSITEDDTAIVTIYTPIRADLTEVGGPADGWMLDNLFQELDIETGAVIFQWRASEHIPLDATFREQNNCETEPRAAFAGCGYDEASSFDYYHLNSVQKDSLGNYLVSARHVFAITYIDGRTGDVLWNLGPARLNDFQDLSGGEATNFKWQHHARWIEEGTRLSLFNNDNHGYRDPPGESHGMVIDLDVPNHTARLHATYYHPNHIKSESQGNMQTLPNGNQLIGWGSGAAFTEFAPNGDVLCDARFGPEAIFSFAPVSSYRVFKSAWTGRPAEQPSAAHVDGSLFVSWNGATEVEWWQVEAVDEQDGDKKRDHRHHSQDKPGRIITQKLKKGFETQIDLPRGSDCSLVRVAALGKDGERLGVSDVVEVAQEMGSASPLEVLIIATTTLVGVVLTLYLAFVWYKCVWRRRRQRAGYEIVDQQHRAARRSDESSHA